ncbi:hypothetical protein KXR53_09165 [Inquilinus limosus]|uniref:hypothetical protein n=1 Tax=Inquilinus limosus TaxID=171674 RepID=UPI003F181BDD
MSEALRLYVGYDSREDIAWQVCRHSVLKHASKPVEVTPLKLPELRAQGIYTRPVDTLGSTEFTFSRFLVPALAGYRGWAVFCDCDFLWFGDIADLFAQAEDRYAVMVVQHDYQPKETVKMDGKPQAAYPRKNWSSLMLFNCGHPANAALTPEVVNRETGAFLHRFQWLTDDQIGALDTGWNWLEGWYPKPEKGHPQAVHYTRGGPWFENYQDVDYAQEWRDAAAEVERLGIHA